MKLNNKGITLVELVVTFSLFTAMAFGMLSIVINLRKSASDKMINKEINEYFSVLQRDIQQDLIELNLEKTTTCSDGDLCINLTFAGNKIKKLVIDKTNKKISYNGVYYPIPNDENVTIKEISSNEIGKFLKIHIKLFERITNQNYDFDIVHPIGL